VAINSLQSINRLVSLIETQCVVYEIGTEICNITQASKGWGPPHLVIQLRVLNNGNMAEDRFRGWNGIWEKCFGLETVMSHKTCTATG
jgi:hypothetical protein